MRRYRPLPAVAFAILVSALVGGLFGRSALANPLLPHLVARELGLTGNLDAETDWVPLLRSFLNYLEPHNPKVPHRRLMKLKQWLKIASNFGDFHHFDEVKQALTIDEFFVNLEQATK